jgi:hypothetical protein
LKPRLPDFFAFPWFPCAGQGLPPVVDLSDIGDEPATIMGAIIINAFRQGADITRNKNPYRLVIDECQNFGTNVLDAILSESGKRELWFTLAPHQFVSQLDERLWHSKKAKRKRSPWG